MRLKDEKFYKTVRDFLDIYLIRHRGYSLNTQKSYREAINLLLLYFKAERGLEYEDFSDTEYLFGGTSIKREAGKDLSIDCALEVTDGTAKVFWISGADEEVTLLETTGTYSDTITLPEGGNYIGIECENFTGSIELNME